LLQWQRRHLPLVLGNLQQPLASVTPELVHLGFLVTRLYILFLVMVSRLISVTTSSVQQELEPLVTTTRITSYSATASKISTQTGLNNQK
jgi:hypothetical protein